MNPPIPIMPCFLCGLKTSETQSIYGVGHFKCFMKSTKNSEIITRTFRNRIKILADNVYHNQSLFERLVRL